MAFEEQFDFNLEPRTFPVRINREDYVLREATDAVKLKYKDSVRATPTFDGKGKVTGFSISNTYEGDGILLAGCLYKVGGESVPLAIIRSWPSRITEKLVEKCKKMSEIDLPDKDAEDSTKKEQTTGGKDLDSAKS